MTNNCEKCGIETMGYIDMHCLCPRCNLIYKHEKILKKKLEAYDKKQEKEVKE